MFTPKVANTYKTLAENWKEFCILANKNASQFVTIFGIKNIYIYKHLAIFTSVNWKMKFVINALKGGEFVRSLAGI